MAKGYVSVMDPAYAPPDDARLATLGTLRGLLDVSPIGLGDLLHQVVAGQSRMTMPGMVGGLLGVPKTPPPGEALSSLLGIGGQGGAYETSRAAINAIPLSMLSAAGATAPSRGAGLLPSEQAGALNPAARDRLHAILQEYERTGPTARSISNAIDLTPQQREGIAKILSEQFGRPIPVPPSIALKPRHGYESRVLKDGFTTEDLLRWFVAGSDDSAAAVADRRGRAGLLGRDAGTSTKIPANVRLTVRGDALGNVYADDVIPEKIMSPQDLRRPEKK